MIRRPPRSTQNGGDWKRLHVRGLIAKYGFVEGRDYVTVVSPNPAGPARIDYHAILSMAKELAMVENNHQGRPCTWSPCSGRQPDTRGRTRKAGGRVTSRP